MRLVVLSSHHTQYPIAGVSRCFTARILDTAPRKRRGAVSVAAVKWFIPNDKNGYLRYPLLLPPVAGLGTAPAGATLPRGWRDRRTARSMRPADYVSSKMYQSPLISTAT